jgi:signal transduction histidine kinase
MDGRHGLRYVDLADEDAGAGTFPPEVARVLDTINRKVAASESLDRIMEFAFESSKAIGTSDRIGLAFVVDDGSRLVSRWVGAAYQPILLGQGYGEEMHGSSLEALLKGRRLRIIDDLSAYLREHPDSRSTRILVAEGVRSSMTCPLVVEGRPVGLLFRSSREVAAYGPEQVRMHFAMAERLAQAVEKAWHIEQLAAANAAYTEMLGFVSHELKSPVASMVLDGHMLLEGYVGDLTQPQKSKIERIIAKGEYLLGLVRDYLDLAHVEGAGLKVDAKTGMDLVADALEPALDMAEPQIQAKGMTVQRDWPAEGLAVDADPDLLRIVALNFVGNAAKYGAEGGRIRVTAGRTEGGFRVAVWNEGPGFPEAQRARLFRKFSRLQTPELLRQKGTGVGLYTVARIVRLHGGRVMAESELGKWAEFSFEIPQPLQSPDEGGGGAG